LIQFQITHTISLIKLKNSREGEGGGGRERITNYNT
jgi:hypothetical protein